MMNVQMSQYLLKESQTVLHTDGKQVYILSDEGISPYPIYLNRSIMLGIGTDWSQHNGYEEIIKMLTSSINTFPMFMLFESYLCRDLIEVFLEKNKLHFELVFENKERDTHFFKVLITNSDDISILMPYFFQSARDSLYTLLSYSEKCVIKGSDVGEFELKSDDLYPSFSFMYDAQELFVIGGEEKWLDIDFIKKFFLPEQITDVLTIDLRK
ncbi:hypothetical protein HWX41_21600 [Bacillus paramycoides]|uniref:hypothetical protein n=1 Tax=Bacillus paramycoides TaxID=2026194 RepID=UPI0015B80B48|nr:hypothetical protein [Bacillus paramycoides]NWK71598.1 hypothetical protein [Bacillus paramycoides]